MAFIDKIILYIMWLSIIMAFIMVTVNLICLISDFILPTYFNYEVVGDNVNIIRGYIMSIKEEFININKWIIFHLNKLSDCYLFVTWIFYLFISFFKFFYVENNLIMEMEFRDDLHYSYNSFNYDEEKFCNNLIDYADADSSSSNKYQASGVNPYKYNVNPFLDVTKSRQAHEYASTYRWFPDFKDQALRKNVVLANKQWVYENDNKLFPPIAHEYSAYQNIGLNKHWIRLYNEPFKVSIIESYWDSNNFERLVSMKVREFNPFPYPLEKPPLTYSGVYLRELPIKFDESWSNEAKLNYWKAEECNNRSKSELSFVNYHKNHEELKIIRLKNFREYSYARDRYLNELYNKINKS